MARPFELGPETIKKHPTTAVKATDNSLLEYHVCNGDTVILEYGATPVPGKLVLMKNGESHKLDYYWNQPFEDVEAVAIGLVRRFENAE